MQMLNVSVSAQLQCVEYSKIFGYIFNQLTTKSRLFVEIILTQYNNNIDSHYIYGCQLYKKNLADSE